MFLEGKKWHSIGVSRLFYKFVMALWILSSQTILAANKVDFSTWVLSKPLPLETDIPGRFFLSFRTQAEANKFTPPTSCETHASYSRWLSLQCSLGNSEKVFKKLQSNKNLVAIHRVQHQYPQYGGHDFPSDPYRAKDTIENGLSSKGQCIYNELCPDGRAKFWAQQRVNGDLMFEFLKEQRIPSGSVTVAVVDSGFDYEKNKELMASPSLTVHKGFDKAGTPTNDENGHGTAVSGLIGGKDGTGLAPNANLRVYRVTESGSEGGTSSDNLKMSIAKACDDGASIINVSWGGMYDERGIQEEERVYADFYKEMLDKGCLIVKSAGNDAKRIDRDHMDVNDALLRVEASELSGNISAFSSNGEIRAPGSGVFSNRSSQVKKDAYNNFCGKASGSFINGTSFSAPITTAVAAQVQAVLKKNHPAFNRLPGRDKILWTTRILRASSKSGNLDANNAVRMAAMNMEALVEKQPIPTEEQLQSAYQDSQKTFCSAVKSDCDNPAGCLKSKACMNHWRDKASRCHPLSNQEVSLMLRLANRLNAADLAIGFLKDLPQKKHREPRTHQYAKEAWEALHKEWKANTSKFSETTEIPFDQGAEILPILLSRRSGTGLPSDPSKAIREFFLTKGTRNRLARDNDADSVQDVKKAAALIRMYQETYGQKMAEELLKEIAENWSKEESYGRSQGLVSATRLWAELKKGNGGKDDFPEIPKLLLDKAESMPTDSLPAESDYLDALLQNTSADKPLNKADLEALKAVTLVDWYRIKNHDRLIPSSLKADFFHSVVERSKVDSSAYEVSRDAILEMYQNAKTHPENYSPGDIDKFWDIVLTNPNPLLWKSVFPLNIIKQPHPYPKDSPHMNSEKAKAWAKMVFEKSTTPDSTFEYSEESNSETVLAARTLLSKEERAPLQDKLMLQATKSLQELDELPRYSNGPYNYLANFMFHRETGDEFLQNPSVQAEVEKTIEIMSKKKDPRMKALSEYIQKLLDRILDHRKNPEP